MKRPIQFRCEKCAALLAEQEQGALVIHRHQLRAAVSGSELHCTVDCYRCQTRQSLPLTPEQTSRAPGQAGGESTP